MAALIVMFLGLASRRYPLPGPPWIGKYPGDALWAARIFCGWSALLPRTSIRRVTVVAPASSLAVELQKLDRSPWLVAMRRTTWGHLLLGHAFSFANLLAYALGVAVMACVATSVHRAREARHAREVPKRAA